MVLYPRRSSAYDTAMTTLLTDFAARPYALRFLVAAYDRDPIRGAALLDAARAEGVALLYAMGSETVAWLHADHPAPGLPVVTVCAKDPVQLGQIAGYDEGSGGDYAFTSLNVLLDVQVAHLLALRPNLRSLGVLVDRANASALETQALPIVAAAQALGVDAFLVTVEDPAQAQAELAAAVPAALDRMRATDPELDDSLFWITGSTAVFTEIATINAHAGPVPVLSVVPEVVREGHDSAALSIGVGFETNAHLAAVYGAEILSGRSRPGDLPVGVVSPPDIAINFARARAIGLRVPFAFFETASFVYDGDGRPVRARGRDVTRPLIPLSRH
jgi:putative ABC transport system substrate-binding protein